MGIDVLENRETNPDAGNTNGVTKAANESKSVLSKIGNFLQGATVLAKEGAGTIAKGAYDTVFAKKNNVPFRVRLAMGGAQNAEDKLKTLRQFYPDAMPTSDNNFEFTDPETKEKVLLDDPGISLGDMVESLPQFGEAGGATAGALTGAKIGSALGVPGAIVGTGLGAAAGAIGGDELLRQASKLGGMLGTSKQPIDNRTGEDFKNNTLWKGGVNALTAVVPIGGVALKNSKLAKLLTDKSAEKFAYLKSKGYSPTIEQIGSEQGIEMGGKQVAGGVIDKQLKNQDVLKGNVDTFLGENVSSLDENGIANQFRDLQQSNISGRKEVAQELYGKVDFGDNIPPSDNSKSLIEQIYVNRGMVKTPDGKFTTPKGESLNPDLVLDSSMEHKMNRIMSGNASEAELDSFRSDISTLLRDKNLKYDTKKTLIELKQSLTDDLVEGSPELSQADREARRSWMDYRETQKDVQNLLGRSEGVTDNTRIGQGATEGQALANAKKIFSSTSSGSDAEAEALSKILSPEEKRLILASILKENTSARGFQNSLEIADKNYNMERVGKFLTDSSDKANLDDLMKQAEGTKAIPKGFGDNSDLINSDSALVAAATAIDPTYGMAATAGLNIARNAPGSAGGSGTALTAMAKQGAFARQYRKQVSNMALRAAERGQVPGNLSVTPNSALTMPATVGGSQALLGNFGNHPESNMRIPEETINANIPKDAPILNRNKPFDFDALLADENKKPLVDLDSLLGDSASPSLTPTPQGAVSPQPNNPASGQPMDVDDYIAKNYGGQSQGNSEAVMDVDDYIAKNYEQKSGREMPKYENKSIKKFKEGRAREAFKEALYNNKDMLEKAGIKGERLNHFLAQLAHESGGFNFLNEIDPSKSNLSDKGGETYKGRGWIQLTGDKNYKRYGDMVGLDLVNNPELAADPDNAVKLSVAYWVDNNLNDLADKDDIKGITRRINGGMNGFNDRKAWLQGVRNANLEL